MQHYRDIIGHIQYGLFLTVVALLPFPQLWLRYACVLWFVTWLLEGRWLSRPSVSRITVPFLLFGLWFGWKVLSVLWVPDHAAWSATIERLTTCGLLVPVGLWGLNERYDWHQVGQVLIVSCLCAALFYPMLLSVLLYYPQLLNILNWQAPWDYSNLEWLTFYAANLSHIKHRLFLSSVEMLGGIVACQQLGHQWRRLLPTLLVIGLCVLMTGSRQVIITGAILLVIGAIYALPQRVRQRYGMPIILCGLIIGSGLLYMHPRMQDFSLNGINEIRHLSYYHDLRFNVWGAALQHPSDYLWTGLGAGQATTYLNTQFEQHDMHNYILFVTHCHNQYLQELVESGLVGLLLFVLAWIALLLGAKRKGRLTAILFTTLFALNMLTDCMFGSFCGVALWAVAILFICAPSLPPDSASDREGCTD